MTRSVLAARRSSGRAVLRVSLSQWTWALTIAGYPVVGLMATLANVESTVASIPFRALVLALALATLALSPQRSPWWYRQRWLLLFWALYLTRLLWDGWVAGVPGAGEALMTFMVFAVIPALAVGIGCGGVLPEESTAWRLGLLAATVCIMAIGMQAMGWGAAQTIDPTFTGGRLIFVAVNPITLGHAATTTLVCVLALSRRRSDAPRKLLLAAMGLVAGLCLLSAASRGSFVSLTACALIFALGTGHRKWVLAMTALLLPTVLDSESDLSKRLETVAGEDQSSLERLVLQSNALQQFLDNPIFGSAHVEVFSGTYPHNIFIEAAMALGIPGLASLTALMIFASMTAWRQLRNGQCLAALLFVQYLVAAQFSGSIWGISPLWVTVVLLGSNGATGNIARALPNIAKHRPVGI